MNCKNKGIFAILIDKKNELFEDGSKAHKIITKFISELVEDSEIYSTFDRLKDAKFNF